MKKEIEETDWLKKLIEVMKRLRGPDGCPWDRKQTHKSLKKYLMEECAELLDSIEEEDAEGIKEELGDLLMHVVLHSEIADQNGEFDIYDVARVSSEKMIRRHPHVFGDESVNCAEEVVGLWEDIKKKEKKHKVPASILDGIPCHFPALLQARAVQKKAAKYGFDWNCQEQVIEKIEEELAELKHAIETGDAKHVDEEIGDLLFAMVNLSRFRGGATAEELLAACVGKFKRRFSYIEEKLADQGKKFDEVSIETMEKFWQEAKKK